MDLEKVRKEFVENLGDAYTFLGDKLPKEFLYELLIVRDGRIVMNFMKYFVLAPECKRRALETFDRVVRKGNKKGPTFNLRDFAVLFMPIAEGFRRYISSATKRRRPDAERKVADD